uniref:G_PROTEIN_RECEP_F1_2 domain-containing protein n=1 Tax=Caenorhabditis tropicalis TaxID=1561998 RepID=A0A1I7V2K8_9PELO
MTPSDSGNATISILEVTEVVNGIGNHVHQTNFVFSCISIVINLFHLLVLSRKSMKTSSTNIILIGLSISDLCIMLTTVYKHYLMTDQESSDCVTADTRVKVYLDLSIWSIQTIFRRCGCWLGVLMATVRFIIVKKLTLSSFNDQIVLRSYTMFDAIVTKFIPCFAFPVLTIALLRVLRKMKEAGGSSGRSSSGEEKKELTTKLIVFMTIAFFITEAPLGGIYLVKALYDRNDPITLLSTDLVVYFSMLVTINSILHPVFCVMMSSQYRNTIRRMCGVKPAAKMSSARNKTSVVSVQGIQMT